MADLTSMTQEQLVAEVARLQAENARLNTPRALTLKVSEKGAISIYGLGRFPVTLYRGQAERVFNADFCGKVQAFIAANASALKSKGE